MVYVNYCPECGSDRVNYVARRVPLASSEGTTQAGYWQCRDCWAKYHGAVDDSDGVLPAGVQAIELDKESG